jgi:hypothetical protein
MENNNEALLHEAELEAEKGLNEQLQPEPETFTGFRPGAFDNPPQQPMPPHQPQPLDAKFDELHRKLDAFEVKLSAMEGEAAKIHEDLGVIREEFDKQDEELSVQHDKLNSIITVAVIVLLATGYIAGILTSQVFF